MSAAHTPGPWFIEEWGSDYGPTGDFSVFQVGAKVKMPIASIQLPFNEEKTEANARLIAAAPEMLKVLTDLLANQDATWVAAGFTDEQIKAMPYLKPARAAIAKVGGAA